MHPSSWDPFQTTNTRNRAGNNINISSRTHSIPLDRGSTSNSSTHQPLVATAFQEHPIITPSSSSNLPSAPPHSSTSVRTTTSTDIVSQNTAPRPLLNPSSSSPSGFQAMDHAQHSPSEGVAPANEHDSQEKDEEIEEDEAEEDSQEGEGTSSPSLKQESRVGISLSTATEQQVEKPDGSKSSTSNAKLKEGVVKTKRKRKSPAVPWKKPKDMPRRPLSAYNLFFKERREAMMDAASTAEERERFPSFGRRKSNKSVGIGFANLAKTIASEWKTLDDTTKAPFEARAAAEKSRYDQEMVVWRKKQKKQKAAASATSKMTESDTSSPSQKSSRPSVVAIPSGDIDFPFQSSRMQQESPTHHTQFPFQAPYNFGDAMTSSQRTLSHRERQDNMMNWVELHSPMSSSMSTNQEFPQGSAMQMSELSSATIRSMSMQQPQTLGFSQHQMEQTMLAQRRQQQMMMMMQRNQHMGSDEGVDNGTNPGFISPQRYMSSFTGRMHELSSQSQITPRNFSSTGQNLMSPSSLGHDVKGVQGQERLADTISTERRNTWSGMTYAQQDAFHQMQMDRLRKEEEILEEQLREHRRRCLEHQQQLQAQRQRRTSLHSHTVQSVSEARVEPLAAQNVSRHPDSWIELQGSPYQRNPLSGDSAHIGSQPPLEYSQQPSTDLFPSTWFEADSNAGSSRNNMDESPIRYNPDTDGDMNQKLPGRHTSSILSSSFGTQLVGNDLKEGKKAEMDPWHPIQLKDRNCKLGERSNDQEHRQHHFQLAREQEKIGDFQPRGGPIQDSNLSGVDRMGVNVSGQQLGMQLDDDSVRFISNVKLGGAMSSPDRSPTGGDR